jgi:hypothetical protein
MLVHIVADYGQGDLAFAEVVQRLKVHLPDAEPVLTPVQPFCTLAAGFCIAQLALNSAPPGAIVYHNVAPREDDNAARAANAGERLTYARSRTGVRVIGVNAGHALSFIRDEAEKLRWAAVEAEGSQFRSRDLFPQTAAAIALGRSQALAEDIDPSLIPDVPASCIAYIDGYGNVKTTLRFEDKQFRPGTKLAIQIDGVTHEALVSDGTFGVEAGLLAFAPGSSGWKTKQGEQVRWVELFLRGGNAWDTFKRPAIGSQIEVKQ